MRMHEVGFMALMTMVAAVAIAAPDEKAAKPVIPCDKIVEVYKLNHSVDETSDTLLIEESRVAECLKAAGITAPTEDDD